MFLHVGGSVSVPKRDIIAILDIDSQMTPAITKDFLKNAEKNGRVLLAGDDLPKSVILSDDGEGGAWVIFSHISARSLTGRAEMPKGYIG